MKKMLTDLDLKNKRVLLRVDFNVPLDEDGNVMDDTRIYEAMPTIRYILKQGAKLIICSHLGRPDGVVDPKYSMFPVAQQLIKYLINRVYLALDVVGPDAMAKAKKLKPGEVLLLENLRFHKEEESDDIFFARKLASMADIYINDAFGTVHRKHASVHRVAKLLPNAMGFLMGKEINTIQNALTNPERPFVAILGGSKVSDKIAVIKNLLQKADTVLVGGAMAFTFLKAQGYGVGTSLVEDGSIDTAKEILSLAERLNKQIVLPVDFICSEVYSPSAKGFVFNLNNFPKNMMGLDIGPETTKLFVSYIKNAKTIIWNGPLGVFEFNSFKEGTKKIAKALTKIKGTTIVGGGDTAAAIHELKLEEKVTHVSTGGGASLKLLEGASLPGIEALDEKEEKWKTLYFPILKWIKLILKQRIT